MKVVLGYKTELDLNNEQRTACKKHAGAARWAYNYGLHRKQEAYRAGKHVPTAIDLHREVNRFKLTEIPWMYEVSKCCAQEALRDLHAAYRNFFHRVELKKQGKWKGKTGYPKFKSKKNGLGSFRLTGRIHVFENAVQLPRLGRLLLKEAGYLPTAVKILCATVSEHAGKWFVSLQVEEERLEPASATGTELGVDLGLKALAMCSHGSQIANPKALRRHLNQLRRASRHHSRRKKGSRNREKARRRLARIHARIANIRNGTLHKATSSIVARTKPDTMQPRVVVIEDLNISDMLKNRRLSRAIADVGLYEFRRQLEYKALQAGVGIRVADRWYPSSKTCSACGYVKDELPLDERVFVCEVCGNIADRDYNAARNLAALA